MKKVFVAACLLSMSITLGSGCTYKAPVDSIKNVNVYSAYEEKIPGNFAIIVNNDEGLFNKTVSPSSYQCGAHDFSMTFADSFVSSIKDANSAIFESIVSRSTIPTVDEMKKDNLSGYILVQGKLFEPRISFIPGFWSARASSTVNIGFDYSIRDSDNNLVVTGTVSGERTHEGEAGMFCSSGTEVLMSATQKAMRDVLERYGERVSNSQKLREAVKK